MSLSWNFKSLDTKLWAICENSLESLHFRSSYPEVFCKIDIHENLAKCTGKHLWLWNLSVLIFACTNFREFYVIYFLVVSGIQIFGNCYGSDFLVVQIFANAKFYIFLGRIIPFKMKKSSRLRTSHIEVAACLSSRFFRINRLN